MNNGNPLQSVIDETWAGRLKWHSTSDGFQGRMFPEAFLWKVANGTVYAFSESFSDPQEVGPLYEAIVFSQEINEHQETPEISGMEQN